jgi:hypothetical protein
MMAIRIQRKRTKGWKAPEGTVNVTRPSEYGNPFKVGHWYAKGDATGHKGPFRMTYTESLMETRSDRFTRISSAQEAVDWYRWYLSAVNRNDRIKRDLAGKNLMCFCALDQPCHADVLLEIANATEAA